MRRHRRRVRQVLARTAPSDAAARTLARAIRRGRRRLPRRPARLFADPYLPSSAGITTLAEQGAGICCGWASNQGGTLTTSSMAFRDGVIVSAHTLRSRRRRLLSAACPRLWTRRLTDRSTSHRQRQAACHHDALIPWPDACRHITGTVSRWPARPRDRYQRAMRRAGLSFDGLVVDGTSISVRVEGQRVLDQGVTPSSAQRRDCGGPLETIRARGLQSGPGRARRVRHLGFGRISFLLTTVRRCPPAGIGRPECCSCQGPGRAPTRASCRGLVIRNPPWEVCLANDCALTAPQRSVAPRPGGARRRNRMGPSVDAACCEHESVAAVFRPRPVRRNPFPPRIRAARRSTPAARCGVRRATSTRSRIGTTPPAPSGCSTSRSSCTTRSPTSSYPGSRRAARGPEPRSTP